MIISTGLGAGFVPVAPGTAGAFVALVLWYIGYLYIDTIILFWTTLAVIIATTLIGVYGEVLGPDPRAVVIDEYVGTWIPLLVAPCGNYTWILALLGFAMFRVIDIFKPLGCRWVDQNVKGGWGVMLDDVLAGFYALIIVGIANLLITNT